MVLYNGTLLFNQFPRLIHALLQGCAVEAYENPSRSSPFAWHGLAFRLPKRHSSWPMLVVAMVWLEHYQAWADYGPGAELHSLHCLSQLIDFCLIIIKIKLIIKIDINGFYTVAVGWLALSQYAHVLQMQS